MLTRLHIRNLAVIDEAEIDFGPGMTVLTGETGAGKSILVDALTLALGARGDSGAVRAGAKRCEITAAFDTSDCPVLENWLHANDLDADSEECIVRRVIGADGRSRGYINGQPVPMQTLRGAGEQLLDVCGQQAHQSLREPPAQRALLDRFGRLEPRVGDVADAHADWSRARAAWEARRDSLADRDARLELLGHHVRELEALDPQPGEYAELERRHRLLANHTRVADGVAHALTAAYERDDGSVHAALSELQRSLDELTDADPGLADVASLFGEAGILVAEAADTLRRRQSELEHDPAEEARLDHRLASFHDLARKHRVLPDELAGLYSTAAAELADLERGGTDLEALAQAEGEARQALEVAAERMSAERSKAARRLAKAVTARMRTLGMPDGRFSVDVTRLPADAPGPAGRDRIEFQVAANPGQPAGPLARVASGGELSRIGLSLQVVAIGGDAVPTLIFDEVDAGVGGSVAEIVGGRLRELAATRQVLCVTHLPQVASQAMAHLRVSKITDGKTTRTTVTPLSAPARIEEIARMLGGVEITDATRAHAEEMLGNG